MDRRALGIPKTDAKIREDVEIFDMIERWGGWAVVVGVVTEFILAAVFGFGKSFPERWGPAIADALIAFGVIVEIYFAKLSGDRRDTLERRSNERVAEANARAEESNRIALEAQLELIKFRTTRRAKLTGRGDEIISALLPFAGTEFDSGFGSSSGEQADFWWDLEELMVRAGWKHLAWPGQFVLRQGTQRPSSGSVAAQNVEIHLHPDVRTTLLPAAMALTSALNGIGIAAMEVPFNCHSRNPTALHILIGDQQ